VAVGVLVVGDRLSVHASKIVNSVGCLSQPGSAVDDVTLPSGDDLLIQGWAVPVPLLGDLTSTLQRVQVPSQLVENPVYVTQHVGPAVTAVAHEL
jgi:hypothetical protein